MLAVRRSEVGAVSLGLREEKVLEEFRDWPLRADEWRAGRFAAKEVLRLGFSVQPSRVEVLPAESGAPVLYVDGAMSSLVVNISHTSHWVAAAVAPFAVGIDVADDEDGARLPRISKRVFSEGEAEACGAHDSVANQAAVWALKEAALKLRIGGVFSPGARSVRVLSLNPPRIDGLQVALLRLDGAALALAREIS